jgi:hypothetical protein
MPDGDFDVVPSARGWRVVLPVEGRAKAETRSLTARLAKQPRSARPRQGRPHSRTRHARAA